MAVDENALYERWREAGKEERPELEKLLYRAVRDHAATVAWKKYPEGCRELAHDVASDTIRRLENFRRKCKFSTWVHEIATRKAMEARRKLGRSKQVFDLTKIVSDADPGTEPEMRNRVNPVIRPNLDRSIDVKEALKRLPKDHATLLAYKCWGLSSAEIAVKLNISQEAVDSKWARIRRKFPKKI